MGDIPAPCQAFQERDLKASKYDGIILISHLPPGQQPLPFGSILGLAAKLDNALDTEGGVFGVDLPAKRFIYSPTKNICPDFDDVRVFAEAAHRGVARAIKAGVTSPLLVVSSHPRFKYAELVTILAALEALYVPIQVREDAPEKLVKPKTLGVWTGNESKDWTGIANRIEAGRFVARDIAGADPERMTAPRIAEYVRKTFPEGSSIKVEVIDKVETFEKEFPLFAAVNRAASVIKRHEGRIIFLTYEPSGSQAKETLMFVGKGVTYDTGGADIKAGGIMAGMSRDKCGAAAVAGFMKVVDLVKPANLNVVAALCVVRNSVGENCYVSDEIITARSKARVRVTNTDAEGRMAMADTLCKMKEMAVNLPNPHLFTVATLTSHAILTVGHYGTIQDNSVAREDANSNSRNFQDASDLIGDPFEISTMRREDVAFHKGKAQGDDLIQGSHFRSSRVPRGHQTPGAFLLQVSGLNEHGVESPCPLKYSHLDIAAVCGDLPDEPTGTPISALTARYLLNDMLFQ